MPIWGDHELPVAASIPQRVRDGNALPILSHSALFDLALFEHERFKRFYAEKVRYPYLGTLPDIGQLANYDRYTNHSNDANCKTFYLDCLKNHIYREAETAGVPPETLREASDQVDQVGVTAFANLLGYPRFDMSQTQPLQRLANLPFKIYLTLSASTFLENALRKAGKTPLTKMCRWRGPIEAPDMDLWRIPDEYRPSEQQPLVYHLCGLDVHPQSGAALPGSLALSEDDHLEMLVNLAEGRGKNTADRLPSLVRGALADDVVLLGFRLDSWAFRGLYYGLIRQTGQGYGRRGTCVLQLLPEERAIQERYLQNYLDQEARFDIYWGSLDEYTKELYPP